MNSVGNSTDLILAADTTLTGGGEIDMSANTANRIYGSSGCGDPRRGTDRLQP